MSTGAISFLFDYISPNAYLAWDRIEALATHHGRVVEPVPVLFAGLLNAHGLVGPAEVRVKWAWMLRDILRKAQRLDIPLEPPASHPFNSLLPLRVTSLPMDSDTRRRLVGALFRAIWAGGLNASDPAAVARIVSGTGLDGPRAVENAVTDATKRLLRRQTEAAVEQGVFGVPTMLVDGELFWGFDDFEPIDRMLSGDEPPLDTALLERWSSVTQSADRRGKDPDKT